MWQGVILGNMPDAFESLADFVERMRDDGRCVNFIGLSRTDLSSEQGMRLAEMIGCLGPPGSHRETIELQRIAFNSATRAALLEAGRNHGVDVLLSREDGPALGFTSIPGRR